jgi:hypothetical protein
MFARRAGICQHAAIWEMECAHVMQLIHADGMRNGQVFRWVYFFEPSKALTDEFEELANIEPPPLE